jgi:hypothetical protein
MSRIGKFIDTKSRQGQKKIGNKFLKKQASKKKKYREDKTKSRK